MQAILTIDLGAIVANWAALASARPAGATAAVLKADAYGLGAAQVGPALAAAGCRDFFVATPAEAVALRGALSHGPAIAVLNGCDPGTAQDAGLLPVVNDAAALADHAAAGRAEGRARAIILHLDTGMARLGFDGPAQARLAAAGMPGGVAPRLVMSHYACADTPDDPMNATQRDRFAAAAAAIAPGVPRSLANSSGLFLGEGFAPGLARPGCALFGINPTPGAPNPMRPVVRLEAPVLQLRDVPEGATVGYGAGWRAQRPSRIATVATGYADGYLRALARGPGASHRGRTLPVVGRISMDLITVDATDAEGLAAGDYVTLIGPGRTPDDLAAAAGTIGYEVLTALGSRHRRVHLPA